MKRVTYRRTQVAGNIVYRYTVNDVSVAGFTYVLPWRKLEKARDIVGQRRFEANQLRRRKALAWATARQRSGLLPPLVALRR